MAREYRFRPLEGKTILLGVSGGIAAFKVAGWIRPMMELGAAVQVAMTSSAARFVSPLTFEALSGRRVETGLFDEETAHTIPHISLARRADVFVVAPATANILAKAACGLADDLLSTLLLSYTGKVVFVPSMNPAMYAHPATRENVARLKARGHAVVEPETGETACGETGRGRLPQWDAVRVELLRAVLPQTLAGRRVLVTAGPTREAVDPVRYISNRSSGKMGYAVAEAAAARGADVHLVSGPVSLAPPPGCALYPVATAAEMAEAVKELAPRCDAVVMAAAVADFRPRRSSGTKIKKGESEFMTLELERTEDILSWLCSNRGKGQVVVGFCAETGDLERNAAEKLRRKGADMLVANDVTRPGAGFDADTNQVLLLWSDGRREEMELMSKQSVAHRLWDRIEELLHERRRG